LQTYSVNITADYTDFIDQSEMERAGRRDMHGKAAREVVTDRGCEIMKPGSQEFSRQNQQNVQNNFQDSVESFFLPSCSVSNALTHTAIVVP
jgi:hypothetical protein